MSRVDQTFALEVLVLGSVLVLDAATCLSMIELTMKRWWSWWSQWNVTWLTTSAWLQYSGAMQVQLFVWLFVCFYWLFVCLTVKCNLIDNISLVAVLRSYAGAIRKRCWSHYHTNSSCCDNDQQEKDIYNRSMMLHNNEIWNWLYCESDAIWQNTSNNNSTDCKTTWTNQYFAWQ